jgi:hypothetical protein
LELLSLALPNKMWDNSLLTQLPSCNPPKHIQCNLLEFIPSQWGNWHQGVSTQWAWGVNRTSVSNWGWYRGMRTVLTVVEWICTSRCRVSSSSTTHSQLLAIWVCTWTLLLRRDKTHSSRITEGWRKEHWNKWLFYK